MRSSPLNEQQETSQGTLRKARRCASGFEVSHAIIQIVNQTLHGKGIRITAGPIASLETLYQADHRRDELIGDYPDLLGGEMEAFGFLPCDTTPWLVVKAVSDTGGSDFSRDQQVAAATRAATVVPPLVRALEMEGLLPEVAETPKTGLLMDLVTGKALEVRAQTLAGDTPSDWLNEKLGAKVAYKLRGYLTAAEYGAQFAKHIKELILELMLNGFDHGNASRSQVTFEPGTIVIEDDGKPYDFRELDGVGGGARAWKTVQENYVSAGTVSVSMRSSTSNRSNRYFIRLPLVSAALREARTKCCIDIRKGSVGAHYGQPELLRFDQECKSLYLDTTEVHMISRRLENAEALLPILKSGRRLYVGCPTEEDVRLFKEILRDHLGSNLMIFVDPTLS